jgi:hypothetical protein
MKSVSVAGRSVVLAAVLVVLALALLAVRVGPSSGGAARHVAATAIEYGL